MTTELITSNLPTTSVDFFSSTGLSTGDISSTFVELGTADVATEMFPFVNGDCERGLASGDSMCLSATPLRAAIHSFFNCLLSQASTSGYCPLTHRIKECFCDLELYSSIKMSPIAKDIQFSDLVELHTLSFLKYSRRQLLFKPFRTKYLDCQAYR